MSPQNPNPNPHENQPQANPGNQPLVPYQTFTIDAALRVRGSNSIIGLTPPDTADLANNLIRTLNQQAGPDGQPPRFNLNIAAGVQIIGDRNVVGSDLSEMVKANAALGRERAQAQGQGHGAPQGRSLVPTQGGSVHSMHLGQNGPQGQVGGQSGGKGQGTVGLRGPEQGQGQAPSGHGQVPQGGVKHEG